MSENGKVRGGDGWVELIIATVLSVSGLMTSWASYQAALWDGEQAAHYSRANALRVIASRTQIEADTHTSIEMALFNSWLQAEASGDHALAHFYETRFPADLKRAFDVWIAQKPLKTPGAALTPFGTGAYDPIGENEARQQEEKADATFASGQEANRISDLFTQGAVFLATAMFFGGIGQVFRVRPVRLALLAVAVITCVVGLVRIVALPVLRPG